MTIYNEQLTMDFFGTAYREFSGKPDEAIEHLLIKQSGHVPAAIHKDGIGNIDFVWGKGGKDGYGLAHIIERRNAEGLDGEEIVRKIPGLIKNGVIMPAKHSDRRYIIDENYTVAVRLDYNGKKMNWVVSTFKNPEN